jgi:hypothetical protein
VAAKGAQGGLEQEAADLGLQQLQLEWARHDAHGCGLDLDFLGGTNFSHVRGLQRGLTHFQ